MVSHPETGLDPPIESDRESGGDTPASATTLLLRGHACSDQCFSTPASATTLMLRG